MLLAVCFVFLLGHFQITSAGFPEINYNVTLAFYHGETVSEPFFTYAINSTTSCKVSSKLDLSKKFFIYIHGWEQSLNDYEADLINVTSEILDDDYIVVKADYDYNILYTSAVMSLTTIGNVIGKFFECLKTDEDVSLDDVVCIGHSLGAHICGIVGKYLDGKIKYIVGLDPAGPLFLDLVTFNRLTSTDAQTVQAIHTSDTLGTTMECGDADFWAYGGETQPGCDFLSDCSHVRAVYLYVLTVLYGNFTGNSYEDSDDTAYMGEIVLDERAAGNYNLTY